MVCPNCGYDNNENNRFCVRCGVDLSVAPAQDTPSFAAGAPGDPSTTPPPPPPPPNAAPPAPPSPWGVPPPAPWGSPGQAPPPPPPPPGAAAPTSPPPNPFAPPAPYGAPAYPPPGAYPQYPPPYPPSGYQHSSTNGFAIAAFVLGLVGWVPCGVGSILAVVFGFVARSQIRAAQGRQGGDGLALAGIILGFVGIALVVLIITISVATNSSSQQ